MAPLIGITTANVIDPRNGLPYNRAYAPIVEAVEAAGGLPILIPVSVSDVTLRALYERIDALLLPGGGDVRPDHYGADPHPRTANIDDLRDRAELTIVRWAVHDDLPVFGICRGHQVMNVALGGTLIQDIPSTVHTDLQHDQTVPRSQQVHTVRIEPTSRLAAILGETEARVNSLHHQSVERSAPGIVVSAVAPDGVIEAHEMPGRKFLLSVQWHPEDLWSGDPVMKRLFRAFVEAANGRSAG